MIEIYITFGSQYRDPSQHPQGMLADGYAVIEAPTQGSSPDAIMHARQWARQTAYNVFGQKWAFDYLEKPEPQFAPLGELMRIPLSRQEKMRDQFVNADDPVHTEIKVSDVELTDDEQDRVLVVRSRAYASSTNVPAHKLIVELGEALLRRLP